MTNNELLSEIAELEKELMPLPYDKAEYFDNLEKWHSLLWELKSLKKRNPHVFRQIQFGE